MINGVSVPAKYHNIAGENSDVYIVSRSNYYGRLGIPFAQRVSRSPPNHRPYAGCFSAASCPISTTFEKTSAISEADFPFHLIARHLPGNRPGVVAGRPSVVRTPVPTAKVAELLFVAISFCKNIGHRRDAVLKFFNRDLFADNRLADKIQESCSIAMDYHEALGSLYKTEEDIWV
ncbi:hypothetical protein N7510_011006 [Penicillium lagena]|uniref:uncharacterized protein n=1 Tax=Penicillium lagena TaxID=94218 RepID=UPI002541E458|nr:uncharacterized protein N7510_011006 [Penicillium lagena]KAJ5601472.1 hypothetical protein N7510_011006 [Penicillium lagena]